MESKTKNFIKEVLESIACIDSLKMSTESFWINKVSHEECARVLAQDTKLARQALKKLEKK